MQTLRIDIQLEDINAVDIEDLQAFLEMHLQAESVEISEVNEKKLN